MSAVPTDEVRSALMKRVRRSGTSPEQVVAAICREIGLAYRCNVRSLPGSPDLANKSKRWAIFVNGCFWHHHRGCPRGTIPKRNNAFWVKKFSANRQRDAAKIRLLRERGYEVVLVWECQTEHRCDLVARLQSLPR